MSSVEQLFRNASIDAEQQQAILDATGWDISMLSKVRSGTVGITIEKLDAVLSAMGVKVVPLASAEIDDNELAALESMALKYLETRQQRLKGG